MKFLIKPSSSLNGTITASGAKNSALPILAATLLSEEKSVIGMVPRLDDTDGMCRLLEHMGAKCRRNGKKVSVDSKEISKTDAPYHLVNSFRGSFLTAAPLLSRFKCAKICMPGGCAIGQRPVDLHLKGFELMGADISLGNGYVELKANGLHGEKIYLDFPSVGATENIMMAATLARGRTIIENAATEPEIADLASFLNKMGAQITGAGTSTVKIDGVAALHGCEHTIIPDRIEIGTYMAAAAAVGGRVKIKNVLPAHIKPITAKLREIGVIITEKDEEVIVESDGNLKPFSLKTLPFPGFPTDMQAQFMTLAAMCKGISTISETIFENRFMHAGELLRMGANIKIDGRIAILSGKGCLSGARVRASDLRAAAALVIAGLCADGETEIENADYIDRGYEIPERKFARLGAEIVRTE